MMILMKVKMILLKTWRSVLTAVFCYSVHNMMFILIFWTMADNDKVVMFHDCNVSFCHYC